MTRRPLNLHLEASRLRAAADEARARLSTLEQRQEAALDLCIPGPSPKDVDHARRLLEAAEAAADAAERMAAKDVAA